MIDLRQIPPRLFGVVLEANLRKLGPDYKLNAHFVEAARIRLEADCAWMVPDLGEPLSGDIDQRSRAPIVVRGDSTLFDPHVAHALLRREQIDPPRNLLYCRIVRHERQVALAAVVRREGVFPSSARNTLCALAEVLAAEIEHRERRRFYRVFDRIKEKIVAELRPRDLAYQILDGLQQLVGYDHSAAFLTWDAEAHAFRVEAEKIVWAKAKSPSIGREIAVDPEAAQVLQSGIHLRTFSLDDPRDPSAVLGDAVRRVLDDQRTHRIPRIRSLIAAPVFFGDQFLGLLKIAASQRRSFDRWDADVVERFLPAAASAIRNARVNLSLETQAVQAEVRASLVTLARVVAHDVNNAVGALLPLAQQVQADLRTGRFDLDALDADLEVIIDRAAFCKRIFANMLNLGSSARSGDGPVDLNEAVREALSFLDAAAERLGITIALDLATPSPIVRFSRQDLEHVVVNLVTNSLQALAPNKSPERRGSRIVISTGRTRENRAFLRVADDGPGIPAELLQKVVEPFFTTKSGGHGLGLALVRSLAWSNGGSLDIASVWGEGTTVAIEMHPFNDHAESLDG